MKSTTIDYKIPKWNPYEDSNIEVLEYDNEGNALVRFLNIT